MNNFQRNSDPLISMKLGDPWKRIQPGMRIEVLEPFSTYRRSSEILSYSRGTVKYKKGRTFKVTGVFKSWIYKFPILNGYEAEVFSLQIDGGLLNPLGVRSHIDKFKKYIKLIDE